MKRLKPHKGHLLISDPNMLDPNFKRSVILLTVHNETESIGFILNQPTKVSINDLIDDFPSFDAPVYIGGPVQKDTLHFIHSMGNLIDGSIYVGENLYWSGNFQTLMKLVAEKKIFSSQIRFFAGYSGWEAGQLERELEEESWIVAPGNSKIAIIQHNQKLWKNFISQMDKEYAIWANMPEDPSLN